MIKEWTYVSIIPTVVLLITILKLLSLLVYFGLASYNIKGNLFGISLQGNRHLKRIIGADINYSV